MPTILLHLKDWEALLPVYGGTWCSLVTSLIHTLILWNSNHGCKTTKKSPIYKRLTCKIKKKHRKLHRNSRTPLYEGIHPATNWLRVTRQTKLAGPLSSCHLFFVNFCCNISGAHQRTIETDVGNPLSHIKTSVTVLKASLCLRNGNG